MPGSPDEEHDLAVAVLGPGPALHEDAKLVLAPDQRREVLAVQRLEAALGAALAFDPPGGQRLGEAFEALRPEVGQLEQPADQPARRLADHHRPGRRERLQSRRQVRRLPDHGLFLGRALADQLADHDQTGRDPDPRRERLPFVAPAAQANPGASSALTAAVKLQPGADRPLGVVLVRLRPAEVRQNAIAHVLGDVPAPALDHLGAAALIGADHATHVLGIEPRRERGRARPGRRTAPSAAAAPPPADAVGADA